MSSKKTDTRTQILEATWQLMEQRRGQGVRMSDIAKTVGISRQAVYLHFSSRTDLMIATVQYVDEVKGLNQRLKRLQKTTTGTELMEACVEVWGNYIPEIYGLAKGLLSIRETDEAAATAWAGCMDCLANVCREIIEALHREGALAAEWSHNKAIEMLLTILSIENWEKLTMECGWSMPQYIDGMKLLIKRTFIELPPVGK